jgi:hypothetical protein
MTKPCPDAEYARDAADVLVQGTVIREPFPRVHLMKVERYYKGEGRQYLLFADTSRPSHGHLVGQEWLIGLADHPTGLALEWCGYLYRPGQESIAALAPGIPPRPGVDAGLWSFWIYLAGSLLLLVMIVEALRFLFPRRKRRTN